MITSRHIYIPQLDECVKIYPWNWNFDLDPNFTLQLHLLPHISKIRICRIKLPHQLFPIDSNAKSPRYLELNILYLEFLEMKYWEKFDKRQHQTES